MPTFGTQEHISQDSNIISLHSHALHEQHREGNLIWVLQMLYWDLTSKVKLKHPLPKNS